MLRLNTPSKRKKTASLPPGPAGTEGKCPGLGCKHGHLKIIKTGKYGPFYACDQGSKAHGAECGYTVSMKKRPQTGGVLLCDVCKTDVVGSPAEGVKTDERGDNGDDVWRNCHASWIHCGGKVVDDELVRVARLTADARLLGTLCAVAEEYPEMVGDDIKKTCTGVFKTNDLVLKTWGTDSSDGLGTDGPGLHLHCARRNFKLTIADVLSIKDKNKTKTGGGRKVKEMSVNSVNVYDLLSDDEDDDDDDDVVFQFRRSGKGKTPQHRRAQQSGGASAGSAPSVTAKSDTFRDVAAGGSAGSAPVRASVHDDVTSDSPPLSPPSYDLTTAGPPPAYDPAAHASAASASADSASGCGVQQMADDAEDDEFNL